MRSQKKKHMGQSPDRSLPVSPIGPMHLYVGSVACAIRALFQYTSSPTLPSVR